MLRLNSQLALAEDGDWGTYRKFFHDETFVATFSEYVGKVLPSASGCACKFIGQMFFATGLRDARWCAASMIKDLEKAGGVCKIFFNFGMHQKLDYFSIVECLIL